MGKKNYFLLIKYVLFYNIITLYIIIIILF